MKAVLKNYRQAPRKVRLVADVLRGKSIDQVEVLLPQIVKRSSLPLKKLVDSAVANAVNNFKAEKSTLFIKEIFVNKGIAMRRFKPGARGRAFPFRRTSSHIEVVLGSKGETVSPVVKIEKKLPAKPVKAVAKKSTVKPAVKKTPATRLKAKKAE